MFSCVFSPIECVQSWWVATLQPWWPLLAVGAALLVAGMAWRWGKLIFQWGGWTSLAGFVIFLGTIILAIFWPKAVPKEEHSTEYITPTPRSNVPVAPVQERRRPRWRWLN